MKLTGGRPARRVGPRRLPGLARAVRSRDVVRSPEAEQPVATRRYRHIAAVVLMIGGGTVGATNLLSAPGTARFERIGGLPMMRVPGLLQRAIPLGRLAAATPLHLEVLLEPSDPSGIGTLLNQLYDRRSPAYHHYLSTGEFAQRFGAPPQAVSAATAALRASGLRVLGVAPDRLSISVAATAAGASRAFDTPIERYRLASGRVVFANTSSPRLPAAIVPTVLAVQGLDDLASYNPQLLRPALVDRAVAPAEGATAALATRPRSGPVNTSCEDQEQSYLQTVFGAHSWTSHQLATWYGLQPLYQAGDQGRGESIGLLELDNVDTLDISQYFTCAGLSQLPHYQTIGADPIDQQTLPYGVGEAALDIETAAAFAPQANLDVYLGGENDATDFYNTLQTIVNANKDQVVSISYGACESYLGASALDAEQFLFQQAAAQGQSVLAASGDYGTSDCLPDIPNQTGPAVQDPASQPYVTAVGGTSLQALPPGPGQTWNQVLQAGPTEEGDWNGIEEGSTTPGASGGGPSSVWPMPTFQSAAAGIGTQRYSGGGCGSTYCRQVPDLSASADPVWGYLRYWDGQWDTAAGTSAATSMLAAMIAIADETSQCGTTGGPLGWLDPALYAATAGSTYATGFHQLYAGSSVGYYSFGTNNSYETGTSGYAGNSGGYGYTPNSGLGSPIAECGSPGPACTSSASGLVPELCATQRTAVPHPTTTTTTTTTSTTTSTTTTTTMVVHPPPVIVLAIAHYTLTRAGTARVPLVCDDLYLASCRVQVVIRYHLTVRTKGKHPKVRHRIEVIADSTGTIGTETRDNLLIRLDRTGKALMRKDRHFDAIATVTVTGGNSITHPVALTSPKFPKAKKAKEIKRAKSSGKKHAASKNNSKTAGKKTAGKKTAGKKRG